MAKELTQTLKAFARDERGGTAIEYALIAAGIAVAIVGTLGVVGETVRDKLFKKVAEALGA
jgi:pilus assembly protein Flp/PilA